MRRLRTLGLLLMVAALAVSVFCPVANAASWPDPKREFNLVATYNPGGQVDAICRISAPYLEKYLGMRVVVQNIPGSGGLVGTNSVFGGRSDGYTAVYTATTDGMIGYVNLSPTNVPWKLSDWRGTGIFSKMGVMGMACVKDKPWKDFADFIEDARKQPPKTYTVASIGPGRVDDLWVIELQRAFNVEFNWVFYDGAGPVLTDMLTGDIDVGVVGVSRSDFLDHPKYRVLVGFGTGYPDGCPYKGVYPTLKDFEKRLGYQMEKDLPALSISDTMFSYMVKKDIPEEAYKKICEAVKKMAADPKWQEEAKAITWPVYITPEEQIGIFAAVNKTVASYVELHKKYVTR